MTKEEIIKLSKYEDKILDLIDNQPDMDKSDLQGVVMAIVKDIYETGKQVSSGK